jgi:hypothetical protein
MANDMKVKIRVEKGDTEVIELDGTSVVFYLVQDDKEALYGLYGEFSLGGLLQAVDGIFKLFERVLGDMPEKIVNNIAGDIAESIIK